MKTVRQQAKDKGHPVIGALKRGADDVYSKNGEVIRNRIYIDDEGTVYSVNWRGELIYIAGDVWCI